MAEEEVIEEDFISFEEDDDEAENAAEELLELLDDDTPEPSSNNNILYIIIAIFTVLAFALLGFLYSLYQDKQAQKLEIIKTDTIIENIQKKQAPKIETDTYQTEIAKAKALFDSGDKKASLLLYEEISRFNKALTYYNIGVASHKKAHYDEAIEAFSKAQENEKLYFESTLNIAITAFAKGDNQTFQAALTQASKKLPLQINSPLYSYYRALIDYYRGFYAEALIPLRHPTSEFYHDITNPLESKLLLAFDNNKEATKIIEKRESEGDFFTLGLLYAKQEEYQLAQKYLLKATEISGENALKEPLSLALVYLKTAQYKSAATLLNQVQQAHKDKASTRYPIKVLLRPSLFDPVIAQKKFQHNLYFNQRNKYSLIFYMTPYQLIDPKQTIDSIHQGANNINADALTSAFSNLHLSDRISKANLLLTRGIKVALQENLYHAQTIFQEGITNYPSSAVLHYNLALTYAKRYDFQNALKHFSKSAVLDTNNLYAAIYADFCAQLLQKPANKDLFAQLINTLEQQANTPERQRLLTLIAIAKDDIQLGDASLDKTALDDVLVLILAQLRQDNTLYKNSTTSLIKKKPHDIISHILSLDAHHDKSDIKAYAQAIQQTLTQKDLDFKPLLAGHAFVKESYIEMLHIAGMVPKAKTYFENTLRQKGGNDIATLQALAYTDIYLQEFDQAYAIYNKLIDTYKQQDSNTLFLGAISSIGAKHHENAIALLELAKLSNTANFESRFALGLLYHESKNLEGAAIQYAKITKENFTSRYFDFNLDKNFLK